MTLAGEGPGGLYRWKGWEEGEQELEMVEHYFFSFSLYFIILK